MRIRTPFKHNKLKLFVLSRYVTSNFGGGFGSFVKKALFALFLKQFIMLNKFVIVW